MRQATKRTGRPDAAPATKPDAKPARPVPTLDDRIRGALASPPAPSDWPTHKARARRRRASDLARARERARDRRRGAG